MRVPTAARWSACRNKAPGNPSIRTEWDKFAPPHLPQPPFLRLLHGFCYFFVRFPSKPVAKPKAPIPSQYLEAKGTEDGRLSEIGARARYTEMKT